MNENVIREVLMKARAVLQTDIPYQIHNVDLGTRVDELTWTVACALALNHALRNFPENHPLGTKREWQEAVVALALNAEVKEDHNSERN